ncbi:MAG: EAL domain-containing protein [Lachnospiraceae bacterium]|nr:EAL domain-containing protein [Lachnospiraceae bacterium]
MLNDLIIKNALLIAALMISFVALFYTLAIKRTDRLRNRIYILMLIFTMICSVCEMGKCAVRMLGSNAVMSMVLLDGIEYIHSIFHILIPMLFFFYVTQVNGSYRMMKRFGRVALFVPALIAEALIITNPFHQLVYHHDMSLNFKGGWGMGVAYGMAVLYMAGCMLNMIANRKALSRGRFMSILFFFPLVTAGIATQLLLEEVKCEMFAVALMMLGVMLTLENEDDRMDATTGVYNRGALKQTLGTLIRMETPFTVVAVRINNYDVLMRLSGSSGVDHVMKRVAECLKEEYVWYRIYRATTTEFMILTDLSYQDTIRLSERIYVRFMDGMYMPGSDTPISATILRASVPDELSGMEEVMLMVDGPLPTGEMKGIIHGRKLAYLTRSTDLEYALDRALKNNGLSMKYQTIHRKEDRTPYAIKALVRMTDPKLGELMPSEFIPQAERTGQIHRIGNMALEEVCRFINSGIPERLGYGIIFVNLSLVQCLQRDFAEHVTNIIMKHGVSPKMLNFEITKPVSKEDHYLLERVMRQLKKKGFRFTIEDFGAGYANVEAIFALDFDVVKIDRSILWDAMESEIGRIVLDNSIRMIKELDKEILVEGVENIRQIDMLSTMDVDYLQGYYFSRPVSREELDKMAQLEDM